MFKVPETLRIRQGQMKSSPLDGNNGGFSIRINKDRHLYAIASDGMGWEHVSVSLSNRCPTWEEMCLIKDLFWEKEDVVMQLHPRESDYVNNHPYCLHLWRPTNQTIPTPEWFLVGVK